MGANCWSLQQNWLASQGLTAAELCGVFQLKKWCIWLSR